MTQTDAIADVQRNLNALFNEALQTHGTGITMAAVTCFAAAAVHYAEHHVNDPNARAVVLGRWSEHFHVYLAALNQQCDAESKPEGMS